MKKHPKIVAVTGGAGQIAYSLLFRIASGEMLGYNQPIHLRILDLPHLQRELQGIQMELEDCPFPLLEKLEISTQAEQTFEHADIVFLLGAKPRGLGMERKDLLLENGKIFQEQGKILNRKANKEVMVFVVGNPCNTNALITLCNAPNISSDRIFSMMRLDENRAKMHLSRKTGVPVNEIKKLTIWGNHSSTQVPDLSQVLIQGKKVGEIIKDQIWLEKLFIEFVQKRGATVIEMRGKSSAGSAAQAIIDSIQSLLTPTPPGEWFSLGIFSSQNPYSIDPKLFFSFPCISTGEGKLQIVPEIPWNFSLEERIRKTEKELLEEREQVIHFL